MSLSEIKISCSLSHKEQKRPFPFRNNSSSTMCSNDSLYASAQNEHACVVSTRAICDGRQKQSPIYNSSIPLQTNTPFSAGCYKSILRIFVGVFCQLLSPFQLNRISDTPTRESLFVSRLALQKKKKKTRGNKRNKYRDDRRVRTAVQP